MFSAGVGEVILISGRGVVIFISGRGETILTSGWDAVIFNSGVGGVILNSGGGGVFNSGEGGEIFNSGRGGVLSIIIGLKLALSLRTCRKDLISRSISSLVFSMTATLSYRSFKSEQKEYTV